MGEPKGPDLSSQDAVMRRQKLPEQAIGGLDSTSLEAIADRLISIRLENQDLAAQEIFNKLIGRNASPLFKSLEYDFKTVMMAIDMALTFNQHTKGDMSEQIRPIIRTPIVKFFEENKEKIERYLVVSENPIEYLEAAVNAVAFADPAYLENLSVEQVNKIAKMVERLGGYGRVVLEKAALPAIVREVENKFGKKVSVRVIKESGMTDRDQITIEGGCTPEEGNAISKHIESAFPDVDFSPYNLLDKNPNSVWKVTLFPVRAGR